MERYFTIEAARSASGGRPERVVPERVVPERVVPERVVTVGFFDGLHLGHARLMEDLKRWAEEVRAEPAVITFDRHPQTLFGGHPPTPVVSLEHRLLLLERQGIAATLVLRFDHALAAWSPERFLAEVIQGSLNAHRLLMGFDSAFGHRRQGDYAYLSSRQRELEIEVRQAAPVFLGTDRISSTLVREALSRWDVPRLEALLGRKYSLLGRVVPGDGRGRGLGFPTANLDISGNCVPPSGVYLADVLRLGREPVEPAADSGRPPGGQRSLLPAVVNIGQRPTFTAPRAVVPGQLFDPARDRVEVHVLDLDADLYGEYLEVSFLAKQREERRFPSVDALVRQIREDVEARRKWRGG